MSLPHAERALVLARVDHGEADRIYTLLGQQRGKFGAIAKGARKVGARLGPLLDLYSEVDLMVVSGRGSLATITGAQRVSSRPADTELERLAALAVVAEVVDCVCQDQHPLEGVYDWAREAFGLIADAIRPRSVALASLVSSLALLGYEMPVLQCAGCGRELVDEPVWHAPEAGGLVGRECSQSSPWRVSSAAYRVLRMLARGDGAGMERVRLDRTLREELEGIVERQVEYHLDRRLRSLRYLRQMA